MNEKTRAQFFNDPIYGPNGPFFWPGKTSDATEFISDNQCRSTEEFLEEYEDYFSNVEYYMANTEYPSEEFVNELRADFHKVHHVIESWPYHTFFVLAFYRTVFNDIFPYQSKGSKGCEAIKNRSIDLPDEISLRERLYDEAISREFLQSLETTQQDKKTEKIGGRISETTWYKLSWTLGDPDSDPLVCKELRRLVKQYNLTDAL